MRDCTVRRKRSGRRGICWRWIVGLVIALGTEPPLPAHEQGTTYAHLAVASGELRLDLSFHSSDLIEHFGLDGDGDGFLGASELAVGAAKVAAYASARMRLTADGTELPLEPLHEQGIPHPSKPLVIFSFRGDLDQVPAALGIEIDLADRLGADHVSLVRVAHGRKVQQAVLVHGDSRYSFLFQAPPSLPARLSHFVALGFEHILIGYDHILFLLALLVTTNSFVELIKIVTAFTIAHSITLALAVMGAVSLPPHLIEAAIAATIVYVAAENLWRRNHRHRWMLTFCFGLIHGFGFANVLRDLELPGQGIAVPLFAFNLGVEFGQLALASLAFPAVLWLVRWQLQRHAIRVVSVLVLACGLGWLIERTAGLELMPL